MSTIRTVNLLWEKRIRQTYPVARYALRDEGTVVLAVPRPLEARTYDRTLLALDGGTEIQGGFAVETLLKLEMSSQAEHCLGMTSDDLYLFRASAKDRFLGERRLLFVDAALSESGKHLITAYSDIAGANFALAFGEIRGNVGWTAEMDGVVSTVAISRQGNRVAAGMEHGLVFLKDASRRDVWEFGVGEPIRALACSHDGVWVAYGSSEGSVGLVDGSGTRQWDVTLPGEIINLALSADGTICAALCRPRKDPNNILLACIGATGQIDWQYASEQLLLGISLSGNGQYLATGARNGTAAVYKVVVGEGAPAGGTQAQGGNRAQSQALALARTGDLRGACRVLEIALAADPADVELYEAWLAQREICFAQALNAAQEQMAVGNFAEAMTLLESLLRDDPLKPEVARALTEAQRLRAGQLHQEALTLMQPATVQTEALPSKAIQTETIQTEALQTQADDRAESLLRAALTVAPLDSLEIRRTLASLRARRSQSSDALAEALLAQEKWEEGATALERAQAIQPTPERAAKLLHALTAWEFTAGMTAYNAKEYREAIFQFKKVLVRDPAHAEAKRYLSFALRFSQDVSNESLNDRFSRLE